MAMDGTVLGKKIVKAMLGKRIKDMSKNDLETMEKSWIKICNEIVTHIKKEADVNIYFPATPNSKQTTGMTTLEDGTTQPVEVDYFSYNCKIE